MNAAKATILHAEAGRLESCARARWLPLTLLTAAALVPGFGAAPWVFMGKVSFALFLGCKWLTWWQNKSAPATAAKHLAYLFAWPGMDAQAFLNPNIRPRRPEATAWTTTLLNICFGALMVWNFVRLVPASEPLVRGWIGLLGLILLLHFGTFHLLALVWQRYGIDAQPLMRTPIRATSLAEFWGLRWNSAFNRLAHDLLFRRLFRVMGTAGATWTVFLASGLVHELVISLPARGGWGLPTLYFVLQGAGLLFERSRLGRKLGLRHGVTGWLFTMVVAGGPVFWLFHPAFITRVILPLLHVLDAT